MSALVTFRRPRRVRAARLAVLTACGALLAAGVGKALPAENPRPAQHPPSAEHASAPVHVPVAVRRELNRAEALLRAQLARLPHEEGIELLRQSESVVLRIPSRVLFRPDSQSLKIDAATGRVLALPERLLRRRHRLAARIEVYTDNIGGSSLNLTLSQQRAQTLLGVLRRAGISAKRLQAQGEGLGEAIASNDTAEGRMRNRRIEFVFERVGTRQPAQSSQPGKGGQPAQSDQSARLDRLAAPRARAGTATAGTATAGTSARLRPAPAAASAGA